MSDPYLPLEIVSLVLAAYYRLPGADRTYEQVSVVESKGGWDHAGLTERAFVSSAGIAAAALVLRERGPKHFSDESIAFSIRTLRAFFREHHYIVASELADWPADQSYRAMISDAGKAALAAMLANSCVFNPQSRLLLFPLTPVLVEAPFVGQNFFIVPPDKLTAELPAALQRLDLVTTQMPPLRREGRAVEPVGSWLGARGPSDNTAKKIKRIVLGALALAPIYRERYGFVLRPSVRNYLSVHREIVVVTSNPHTPPLADGLRIRVCDHVWLRILDSIIASSEKLERSKRNALDYFFRGWFLDPVERCPIMFMALEALFENREGQATQRLREGMLTTLDAGHALPQINKMIALRNSVIHGGSPDVFASSIYQKYWSRFGTDISIDLEVATAKCLRKHVFGDAFVPQGDPHEELVAEHRALGHLPTEDTRLVIPEWP
ncbi:hypothetical protein [Nitratireductor alexandrii]|uniref:hypothetical protein n=1 Tax=Nitratireductor alexandrii TaxID=2448161 RepID=UPI000FDB2A89|nr:hypothetical protein [Nitratireductor alexandrii]